MKKILGLMILLAAQISFAASVFECEFAVTKNNHTEIIKKSKELERLTYFSTTGVEFVVEVASLSINDEEIGLSVAVAGSVSNKGNNIDSQIQDTRSYDFIKNRGESKVHSEHFRTTEFGDYVEGVAVDCKLK
jgi:hypothetical protein